MSTAFRITLRCTDCGNKFRRTVESPDEPDPPCPKCAKVPQNIGLDVAAGVAPSIGGNPANKAMDFTMETVAQEYGFTDLSTDAREGETMTPKLPPAQQATADAMFNPSLRQKSMGASANKLGSIAAEALAGGYRPDRQQAPDPVAALHARHQRGAPIKANFVNP